MIRWVVLDSCGEEVRSFDDPWDAADLAISLGDCDVIMDYIPDDWTADGRLDGIQYL